MRYPHGIFLLVFSSPSSAQQLPLDALHVARWAKTQYGAKSPVVAVFMTHAVLNCNHNVRFLKSLQL